MWLDLRGRGGSDFIEAHAPGSPGADRIQSAKALATLKLFDKIKIH
jgi:hypothetical protein